MSSLGQFADHCRAMSTATHKPECKGSKPTPPQRSAVITEDGYFGGYRWTTEQPPTCAGCVTDADRALFALLAAEVDEYLAPQVDLFGELTAEPAALADPETETDRSGDER